MKPHTFIKIIILVPIFILVMMMAISYPINNMIANNIITELKQNPLPEKTVIVEEKSIAAKLCGNGDGVQYFGALLLKSELSLKDLDNYYSQFRNREECNMVERQCGQDIEQNEFPALQELSFDTDIDDENYYILYTWGNYDSIFTYLDWRGIY